MIEFQNVVKTYDNGLTAVSDLTFTAPTGQITVLVGPSGCGKTTTLRMINRLITETSGTILLGGVDNSQIDIIKMRRQIGYVIQNAGLFPHRTILDNIRTVLLLNRVDKRQSRQEALRLLDLVGLDAGYAGRYPWQLSGGQQQRVGVARALAADPPYMLMDEPFSAVDPIVRKQLQAEFLRIQGKVAKTIVMVTHDIDEALRLGDQIIVLREGGVLGQIGAPTDLVQRPANQFVADFLGESRGYHALAFAGADAAPLERVPTVRIGERPEVGATGWTVVLEGGRPIGWIHAADVTGTVAHADIAYASAIPMRDGHQRSLLDAGLASPSRAAIVTGLDGALLGVVRAETLVAADTVPQEV